MLSRPLSSRCKTDIILLSDSDLTAVY
jgi:hypothetical protein